MPKYNLNQCFESLSGEPLKLRGDEFLTLRGAMIAALEAPPIENGQLRPLDVPETMSRMRIGIRLMSADAEIDLTTEEISDLKKWLTRALQPAGTIAVFAYLEGAEA